MNGNDYADLDNFGGGAVPQHAFAPGLNTLADGAYDMVFGTCKLDKAEGASIVRCAIHVDNRVIEHTYWLNRQQSVNGFLAEMAALGFPAQQWGSGPGKTALSLAIPWCVAQLEGVRFRAVKSHRDVPAKPAWAGQPAKEAATYHDLHISGRLGQGAPMPAIAPVTTPAHPPLQPVGVGPGYDPIPF